MTSSEAVRYENQFVAFVLPSDWSATRGATADTPAEYQSGDGRARLTLSYNFYDADIAMSDLRELFEAYFAVRVTAEREVLTASDVLDESPMNADQESVWRSFAGLERAAERRFNGLVAAENGTLLTFYFESGWAAEIHNEQVQSIFGSVEIK